MVTCPKAFAGSIAPWRPFSLLSQTPLVLTTHPSVPVKSVKDLIELARRHKGMNVGGNTAGTTAHLAAEMFNQRFGLKSQVVTYRGAGPAVIALISGEIDYIFATAPSVARLPLSIARWPCGYIGFSH